jgi:hypothetical protein
VEYAILLAGVHHPAVHHSVPVASIVLGVSGVVAAAATLTAVLIALRALTVARETLTVAKNTLSEAESERREAREARARDRGLIMLQQDYDRLQRIVGLIETCAELIVLDTTHVPHGKRWHQPRNLLRGELSGLIGGLTNVQALADMDDAGQADLAITTARPEVQDAIRNVAARITDENIAALRGAK